MDLGPESKHHRSIEESKDLLGNLYFLQDFLVQFWPTDTIAQLRIRIENEPELHERWGPEVDRLAAFDSAQTVGEALKSVNAQIAELRMVVDESDIKDLREAIGIINKLLMRNPKMDVGQLRLYFSQLSDKTLENFFKKTGWLEDVAASDLVSNVLDRLNEEIKKIKSDNFYDFN